MEGVIRVETVQPGRRADGPVLPIRQRLWPIPLAILASGVLVSGALLAHRYESHAANNLIWRVDRLTGEVVSCAYGTGDSLGQRWCSRYPTEEAK